MKYSTEMLENLQYFWNTEIHVHSFFFHFVLLYFSPIMNALVHARGPCQHIPGHKKNYMDFCIPKVWQILKHFSRALS